MKGPLAFEVGRVRVAAVAQQKLERPQNRVAPGEALVASPGLHRPPA